MLLAIFLQETGDIRFKCVAHYVKVVATPKGFGSVWTPGLFSLLFSSLMSNGPWLSQCLCFTRKGLEITALRIVKVSNKDADGIDRKKIFNGSYYVLTTNLLLISAHIDKETLSSGTEQNS